MNHAKPDLGIPKPPSRSKICQSSASRALMHDRGHLLSITLPRHARNRAFSQWFESSHGAFRQEGGELYLTTPARAAFTCASTVAEPDLIPNAVVAIPAKNEAQRLRGCLKALAEQVDARGRPLAGGSFGVVIFLNNCTDDSPEVARRAALACPFEVRVVEAQLPLESSHAGGARRRAMDLAAAWLGERAAFDGVILTTDADSRAAPNWIVANLTAFAQGAQAVLGRISLDEDAEALPPALHVRGKLESVYEEQLTEISSRLDPQDENPWPHHATISGATLAVSREIYLRVGGLPCVPLGEDKALVAALRRIDARLRFSCDAQVVTSARMVGRAPGGVADTLRLRSDDPAALCDEALEPCATAFRRALWRGRLRRRGVNGAARWRSALAIAGRRAEAATTFGDLWEEVEQSSPRLARRRLSPGELPREIERAARVLRKLQERLPPDENIEAVFRPSLRMDPVCDLPDPLYEELGGGVAG